MLAARVAVVAVANAESGRGLLGCVGEPDRRGVRSEWSAALIGEADTIGLIGVAGDAELASVVRSRMGRTEADDVLGVGAPAVLPVHDVMDV